MLLLTANLPQQEISIFDCITMQKEIFMPAKEVPLIDYLIKEYPRNENTNTFPFVYGLFESKDLAFADNQDAILNIANSLFSTSFSLGEFEQKVLNSTFKKSIKQKPSLSGRK